MNYELTLAFPLAVHEQQDVGLSKPEDFLVDARRRMTLAAMVTEGDVCTHGIGCLISDAIELTRAADAKAAGSKIVLESETVSIGRLKDLAQAILCATSEMETLDEGELDAVNDLLLALTNGLERHANQETARSEEAFDRIREANLRESAEWCVRHGLQPSNPDVLPYMAAARSGAGLNGAGETPARKPRKPASRKRAKRAA